MESIKGKTFTDFLTETDGEYSLNDLGRELLKRGGDDLISDDQMLMLEVVSKLDGVSKNDLQTMFISLRESYGNDARRALADGAVRFEKRLQ